MHSSPPIFIFFFNDTATTEIYTLSLHDALPISRDLQADATQRMDAIIAQIVILVDVLHTDRSEEHTSELQSLAYLVCRLLLEKKKKSKQSSSQISVADEPASRDVTARQYLIIAV